MKKETETREKFFADFGQSFGEVVSEIEMAYIEAPEWVLKAMNLSLPFGVSSLWGLLVYCESKKLYFYVHPSESMMGAMLRVASQKDGPKEQNVCLSDLKGFKIVKRQKHWYDFLNTNAKFQICCEFEADEKVIQFTFNTVKKSKLKDLICEN